MTILDNLRKEAKRWMKALRAHDADARARLDRAYPTAPAAPGLRDVQHALARERGHESWPALKAKAAEPTLALPLDADAFLRHAAPDWRMGGGPHQVRHRHTAERILRHDPDMARANLFTRIVCGDRQGVERILSERPAAAREAGGPKNWPPLLYLCAGRLTLDAFRDESVAIARLLLDHGADPNTYFQGGDETIHYTALTVTVGQGEEHAPFHPQVRALVALLLERGAEPYDIQLFYNIAQGALNDDITWLLDLIYDRAIQLGRKADWEDPEWRMIDMGGYGFGARFILDHAVRTNQLKLAGWAVAHGAGPNALAAKDKRWSRRTLLDEAFHRGLTDMADLLARYGGTRSDTALDGEQAFTSACLRLDREAARGLVAQHPEYLRCATPLRLAAQTDRSDVVEFLLDLGMSPDVESPSQRGETALHLAAYAGAARVTQLLVDRGAKVDPVDATHDGTPLWWAMWGRQAATIAILERVSVDLWALAAIGNVARIRTVVAEHPESAKWTGESTPLFWLPDDEDVALTISDLLLSHGADPLFVRKDGKTAADVAAARGMLRAAARLGGLQPKPLAKDSLSSQTSDPISGTWGDRKTPMLVLRFDGKTAVSGTTFWRTPGRNAEAPIRQGTFDPKNGRLRVEGEAELPEAAHDNSRTHFVIEALVDDNTLTGTYEIADHKGPFTFTRITERDVMT